MTPRGRRRARAGRLPHGLDGRRIGLAADPRRDGEGHRASSRFPRRRGCCATRASRSASSCSSAIRARRWEDIARTLQMVRECRPDDIGISVSYPLPRHAVLRARQGAARGQAELGGLERHHADVPGHVRAGVLSRAARARARRVQIAQAGRQTGASRSLKRPLLKWRVARLARLSPRSRAGHHPADAHASGRGCPERTASLKRS